MLTTGKVSLRLLEKAFKKNGRALLINAPPITLLLGKIFLKSIPEDKPT
jgi:hypothetical protein